jgi:hypothetical protein
VPEDPELLPSHGDPDSPALGLDPALCGDPCPSCGGPSLDLGAEQADIWVGGKHWYKCASCGWAWSKPAGPAREPPFKSNYSKLKEEGLI